MLEGQQAAAGTQHAGRFDDGPSFVGHGAQHQAETILRSDPDGQRRQWRGRDRGPAAVVVLGGRDRCGGPRLGTAAQQRGGSLAWAA